MAQHAYIDGPVIRDLPANLATGSTYDFPVGNAGTYLPFSLANPTTGAGGAAAKVQAVVDASGGTANVDGTLVDKSDAEYWSLSTTGDFTNSSVSVANPGGTYNAIGGSTSIAGSPDPAFTSLAGSPSGTMIMNSNAIDLNTFFVRANIPASLSVSALTSDGTTPATSVSTTYGTPSSTLQFDVTAMGIVGGVLITAPAGFEVSSNPDGISDFGDFATADGGGTTTIFVRLKATDDVANSPYSGDVTVSGTGVSDQLVHIDNSTVTQAALTLSVEANDRHKMYGTLLAGEGAGSTEFAATGLQNSDQITSVTVTFGSGAAASFAAGTYTDAITPSNPVGASFDPNNYNITYVNGDIIVDPAPLTITANDATKAYGLVLAGGAGSTEFTSSPLQNGETIGTVTIAYGAHNVVDALVGTYPNEVTASDATGGTFDPANYDITYEQGSLIVVPGAFTKLQILLPGETADPTAVGGKTGSPTSQTQTSPFNVTVNAVDDGWNIVTSADMVHLTSTDAFAGLPADAALVSGTVTLPVTLNTVGTWTITASDATNNLITANESAPVNVTAISACNTVTTIWSEPFTYSNGTTSGAGSPNGVTTWSTSTTGPATFSVNNGSLLHVGTSNNSSNTGTWVTTAMNLSGYTDINVSIDLSDNNASLSPNANITCEYSTDNGGTWTTFTTNGSINDNFGSVQASTVVGTAASLILRVRITLDDNDSYRIDNISITGNSGPIVTNPGNQIVCPNIPTPQIDFSGSNGATGFLWTNNHPEIGLAASGAGSVPSFSPINNTTSPIVATIRVTPSNGSCTGTAQTFTITVNPTPVADFQYSASSYCKALTANTQTPTFINNGVAGTFTFSPAGLVINPSTGVIDLQASASGTYTVTNTIAATGTCPETPFSTTVEIRALPQATISYSVNQPTIFCTSDNSTKQVTLNKISTPITGSYSASPSGLNINTSGFDNSPAGDIIPSLSTPGTYTVTYSFFGGPTGCPNIATTTVIIDEPAMKTISAEATNVCTTSSGTFIDVAASDIGTSYQLRNDAGDIAIGSPVAGTGGTIQLPTLTITTSTTFNVLAITANSCTKEMGNTVTVDVTLPPTASTSGFQVICDNQTLMLQPGEATATNYTTLSWSEDGAGSITAGGNTLTPTYSPAAGDVGNFVNLILTASNGVCPDVSTPSGSYQILVNPSPVVSLNSSYICIGSTSATVLSVTAPGATDGNFWESNNPSVATVTADGIVTGVSAGSVTFTYHDLNGGCDQTTAALTVDGTCQVVTLTQPDESTLPTVSIAGTLQTVCESSDPQATFVGYTAATNNPISYSIDWDNTANAAGLDDQPSTPFTFDENGGTLDGIVISGGALHGTYNGMITVTNANGCTTSQAVSITIDELPVVSDQPDQTLCNTSTFTMTQSAPTVGTGVWTLESGTATITDPNDPATTITDVVAGTSATLRWTVTNGTCSAFDEVTVQNDIQPVVSDQPDQTLCNTSTFTMTQSAPTVGTGVWTLESGTATITDPNDPATTITDVVAGTSATLRWTVTNGTCSAFDEVTVQNDIQPVVSDQPDQTLCNTSTFTMTQSAPTVGTGVWTLESGTATITDPNDPATTITDVVAGTSATLRWTVTNGTCSAFDEVTVQNDIQPVVSDQPDQTLCNTSTFTMTQSAPTVGTGVWTLESGTATITDPNDPATTITDVVAGTSATLRWTVTNGTCSAFDEVTVQNDIQPVVSDQPDQTLCNTSTFTMTQSAPTVGTGVWTLEIGTATITDPNDPATTITDVVAGTSATLRWTVTNGTCSAFDEVTVQNDIQPVVSDQPDQTLV